MRYVRCRFMLRSWPTIPGSFDQGAPCIENHSCDSLALTGFWSSTAAKKPHGYGLAFFLFGPQGLAPRRPLRGPKVKPNTETVMLTAMKIIL